MKRHQGHSRAIDTEPFGLFLPRARTCRDTPECYTAPPGQIGKPSAGLIITTDTVITHCGGTHVVVVLLDDGLVEADGLLVFVLHEKHVGHVQLPRVVVITDLHRLAENLLHHLEVLPVPVNLGLGHQDHDIPERGHTGRSGREMISTAADRTACVRRENHQPQKVYLFCSSAVERRTHGQRTADLVFEVINGCCLSLSSNKNIFIIYYFSPNSFKLYISCYGTGK